MVIFNSYVNYQRVSQCVFFVRRSPILPIQALDDQLFSDRLKLPTTLGCGNITRLDLRENKIPG
jgi:hypothetical protein